MKTQDAAPPESPSSNPPNSLDYRTQDLPVQMPVLGIIPQFTAEEISQIKALISERTKKTNWQRIKTFLISVSANPFILLLVSFVFTGLGVTYLNNKYTTQQQDLAAIRSFSDELNKLRIQKVGEVWERLDEDEFTIDGLIQAASNQETKDKGPTTEQLTEVIKRLQTDRGLVSKYRFWLGKRIFDSANEYLNANILYILHKVTGSSEEELQKYLERRNAAKSGIEQVREQFLNERGLPAISKHPSAQAIACDLVIRRSLVGPT